MPLQQPGVGEAPPAAAAGMRPLPRVDLHVRLDVSELPEPRPAHLALVGLLPRVDAQVSQEVCVDPEGLVAVCALVRLLPGVLQPVGLQRLVDDEGFPADVAGERPLSGVDALVVLVRGFVAERLAAFVAVVLRLFGVEELVSPQRPGGVEALPAGGAAERRHVSGGFVLSIDDSAVSSLLAPPLRDLLLLVSPLMLLQLTVVEERLPAQVAHERFPFSVEEHVRL